MFSAPDPSTARRRWTAEEVRALQREDAPAPRFELIDGDLYVTPSPTPEHQRATGLLFRALSGYVEDQNIGEVFTAPADIGLEPESVLQPDIFVVPARVPRAAGWRSVRSLLLAVEILSPSTARADRVAKRRYFTRNAVPEYWIVDLDARLLERWRPGEERGELLTEAVEWRPRAELEPLRLDLAEFFGKVLG
jgi:Uma2 family endonuclease